MFAVEILFLRKPLQQLLQLQKQARKNDVVFAFTMYEHGVVFSCLTLKLDYIRMAGITLCPLTPGVWQWRQLLRAQNGQLPVGISAGETNTPAFYRAQVANEPGLEIDA